ncbi:MAG: helix-turn-helix transcriptional regulator [Sulfurimonas sp.]|uniref:helix-turn-helix domain-containing protein n=1 Tax=Sulfurimonas sp. TaxID=2022749 RepID=UPI002613A076|nr:helix-turn-helix transcriptional regulator [Sulfurimonas sp.]MDD5373365.1 helix-turn-helix transcriptional regulator [Sulfurimonas sp.]
MKQNLTATQAEIDFLHKEISSRVRFFRKTKNRSQLELATDIGFSSSTFFGNAEANRENKHFNLEHLYLIAKSLDICICNFIPQAQNCLNKELTF